MRGLFGWGVGVSTGGNLISNLKFQMRGKFGYRDAETQRKEKREREKRNTEFTEKTRRAQRVSRLRRLKQEAQRRERKVERGVV
jgi:hypothetical protein